MGENRKVTLSIIIPAYNAEAYLRRCLNSVTSLTISDYEVIVVDDGSTDGTYTILDEYAQTFSFVRVYRQVNMGANLSRKKGLENAIGEYVTFVDADDWVDEDLYRTALIELEKEEKPDIVVLGCTREYPFGCEQRMFIKNDGSPFPRQMYDQTEAIEEMLGWKKFSWFLWDKVYRRRLFDNCTWDERMTTSEDLWLNWEVFHKTDKVLYLGNPQYHYYQGGESLTRTGDRLKKYMCDQRVFGMVLSDTRLMTNSMRQSILSLSVRFAIEEIRERIFASEQSEANTLDYPRDIIRKAANCSYIPTTENQRMLILDIINDWEGIYKRYRVAFDGLEETIRNNQEKLKNSIIYGTGIVADYTTRIMQRIGIDVAGFVVSDQNINIGLFHGKRVYCLSELPRNERQVVFVPTQTRNMEAILSNLRKAEIRGCLKAEMENELF